MRTWFLIVLCLTSSEICFGEKEPSEQFMSVAMRQIGHEILLTMNDQTSRVLPIQKVGERFEISFENEFSFEPDSIVHALERAMVKSKAAKNYILEIQKCNSDEVIHALVIGGPGDDVIPCGSRAQPKGCYQLYFTNLDVPEELDSTQASEKKSPYDLGFLILAGGLLAVFSYVLWRKKPEETTEQVGNPQSGVEIGNYILEPNSMKLILKGATEQLSGKECELLILLNNHRNENVERDTILKEVWGDQGDYVGRTLDVFISKLRKKLKADSNIEIKNIRGIGYRLIVS